MRQKGVARVMPKLVVWGRIPLVELKERVDDDESSSDDWVGV